MKAVILAGGFGTRISEETRVKPKPMVEIGGKPILWHILKLYSFYGINDFVICCGYKGFLIKEYFYNYSIHMSDITIDFTSNQIEVHQRFAEPWRVTLVDTGEYSMTGGRLKMVSQYLSDQECFCMTYGDGVSSVNISRLVQFHKDHGLQATLTSTHSPSRFGVLDIRSENIIHSFKEKPHGSSGMINGGFFVLSPEVINLIPSDQTIWEKEPLEQLAEMGQLKAFHHDGFWHPMDTLRDKNYLEELWASGSAPWKVWS